MNWIHRTWLLIIRSTWLKDSDWVATRGRDGIESASSWARHIIARDFPGCKVGRSVIVVEVIDEKGRSYPIYAGSEVELSPIVLSGLLASAQDLARQSASRNLVEQVVNQLLPQLVEQLRDEREGPTVEQMKEVVGDLLKGKLGEDPTAPKRRL